MRVRRGVRATASRGAEGAERRSLAACGVLEGVVRLTEDLRCATAGHDGRVW